MESFGRLVSASAAAGLVLAGLVGAPGAVARAGEPVPPGGPVGPASVVGETETLPANLLYHLSPQLAAALGTATIDDAGLARLRGAARPRLPGQPTPALGTTSLWPAVDMVKGVGPGIYLKAYTLRAVGKKIEVWVASGSDGVSSGTAFPAGDCRNNTAGSTEITETQVRGLVEAFDNNMYPKESAAFSTPPDRNGTATLPAIAALGVGFAGAGDHTVTLVDNVRDPNFYDFPAHKSYVAGFFAPIFNRLTDRNVMTVDAFDWAHRTGANPEDRPSSDLCTSRPARPFLYESTFGHEWQHLLESYQDPDEVSWVNEGLSMFAESLDGYIDTRRGVTQTRTQPQLLCFQGYGTVKGPSNPNPTACGGPQNSLTVWGDEGKGSEILADYGNALSFMLHCYDRFGLGFISGLHRDGKNHGLAGVQAQLDKYAPGTKVETLLHEFQLMNLIDHYAKSGKLAGISRSLVTAKDLDATLNLDNPATHQAPGAPPNGADYLKLGPGSELKSLTFTGARTVIADVPEPDDPTAALSGLRVPGAVAGWYVSLVGIDPRTNRVLVTSNPGFTWTPDARTLAAYRSYPRVVAVVAHDDPTDSDPNTESYAHYTLAVNGNVQPGG